MNIFCDYHHQGLAQSLQLLFEKRLGHHLFFPTGMEWFDEGYWKIGDPYGPGARNTALQFLAGTLPSDGTGIVTVPNGVTLNQFKQMHIDLIIASYHDHIPVYKKLQHEYHPNAKLIFQMGNEWFLNPLVEGAMVDGILCSTEPFPSLFHLGKPVVFYHQEFDTELYSTEDSFLRLPDISSFVNALPCSDMYKTDWRDFQTLEQSLPEYHFRSFGGGCRDGSLPQDMVVLAMKTCQFAVHFKEGGDGYGHIIHQLAATGTPVIFKSHQYKGKLAEVFLEDGKTGFDWDRAPLDNLVERIKSASNDERAAMSHEISRRFKEHVDFDLEQHKIEEFLTLL